MSTRISVYCDHEDEIIVLMAWDITLRVRVDAPEQSWYEWTCPSCCEHYVKSLPDIAMHRELLRAGVIVCAVKRHPESFDVNSPPLNNDDLLDFINDLKAL